MMPGSKNKLMLMMAGTILTLLSMEALPAFESEDGATGS